MANNKLVVDERQSDIGNFIVGRLLPFRKKRQVGPFTFIDHMGPATIGNGHYMDVDQHPHIGLSTLTYLFQGEIEHRDSLGTIQLIQPGDVGFMTAGKGVTHTERTPIYLRGGNESIIHGYQIWVALPKDQEEMEPRFDYFAKEDIPVWQENRLTIKLVAGQAFGKKAPLQGFSHLFMVDVFANEETTLNLHGQVKGEIAFVIVKGSIKTQGEHIKAGQMLVSKTEDECEICLEKDSQILLFGGEAFPEERFLMWNFVSHNRDRLEKAKKDWDEKRFPKVPNDATYIPFPNLRKK